MHLALPLAALAAPADPLGRPTVVTVLWALVQLGVVAAVALVAYWIGFLLWRRRVVARLVREHPERAEELRREVRQIPVLRAPGPPKDPLARTHHVVVPPRGDGRPGESFWAPGPAQLSGIGPNPDGSRQDLFLTLAPGVDMIVRCMGRLGAQWDDAVVLPARERVGASIDGLAPSGVVAAPGPADRVVTPAGEWWRVTLSYRTGHMVTDSHVDHDGWGFVVGVVSRRGGNHPRAVEILDHVLATWRWLPAQAGEGGSTRSA